MAGSTHKEKELLEIVANHPDGVALPEILDRLTSTLPRRTLQYRLKRLVESGQLQRTGNGRWTQYRSATSAMAGGQAPEGPTNVMQQIPLSPEGREVCDCVQRPLGEREPVGYDRGFLDRYEPNATFFLDNATRRHLATIGKRYPIKIAAGAYAKGILNRLLIDLSWNSSRLEGNMYSLTETRRLIDFGEEMPGRDPGEAQMILNHKDAIEFLVGDAEDIGFNRYTLLNLHALLANNLLPDPAAPGRLRSTIVGIEGSVFQPLAIPQLIGECLDQILKKAATIVDPFEQAFFVMVHLPYLQPFDDVNKRVSRLSANLPLIQANCAPLSFADVPRQIYTSAILGVYELTDVAALRDLFIWAYERSAATTAAVRQSLGEPDPFRLQHRNELREIIAWLVRCRIPRNRVIPRVAQWASERFDPENRNRFAAIVEAELIGLHAGNFARYRINPAEFAAWQDAWMDKQPGMHQAAVRDG